ncbi:MAG: branched-chain amino acid ABC transporter permease [Eubacteriaceae bacterium]|nr:branched-chain amino acid ABC transporter permease [Eubacteriaceae bacterium]
MDKKKQIIISLVLIIALFAGLWILERMVGTNSMLIVVLKKAVIYALLVASINLLQGFSGLFSLGEAGFMLLGAYTYAIFTIPEAVKGNVYQYYNGGIIHVNLPVWMALILGGLVAAFFAFLIGFVVLKLKSDYLAIATLGFAEIIRAVFQWDALGGITNGSNILRSFPGFKSVLYPFAVVGLCMTAMMLLINSSYGRAYKAIRDDEIAAEAMGINLFKTKLQAFVISSFFAGIGGGLLAMYQLTVKASTFTSGLSDELLLIAVIGGIGSMTGSVIASFLYVAANEWWLRFLDQPAFIGTFQVPLLRSGFRKVVFSVIIMLIVLFYHQGLMGTREFSIAGIFEKLMGLRKKKKAKVSGGGTEK